MNAIELLRMVVDLKVCLNAGLAPATLHGEIVAYLASVEGVQLIIAGSARQAESIARLKGVRRYKYVSSGRDLEGPKRGQTVWLFGTYYNLIAWQELRAMCAAYEHEFIEVRND